MGLQNKNEDVSFRNENDNETGTERTPANVEDQHQKLPYPKSVYFIISNEFCERFNYYGMRTILVLYLTQKFAYSEDTATVIFHFFTMFVYFLCLLGAILADSWLGKFKTILYLSFVYVFGSAFITCGAIPPLNLPGKTFTMIGLGLIALGSGGIKPCVAAFGGDQFKLPEQAKQVVTFFSLFYFAINSGSLLSTTITPILRADVHCFDDNDCFPLAFGVPAILMLISILVFVLGKSKYVCKPPAGNMVVLVCKTIGNAISTKFSEGKTNPRDHWLDYADRKYGTQLVADVKVLMRVLLLYLPLPFFWALFDQQGSRWTFQATRMDGDIGAFDIKPDQLQMVNPFLILAFIPLYEFAFYPFLNLIGIRRPLQKLTLGGIFAGVAFVLSALVELKLEATYPVLPSPGHAQLRIFNGVPQCDYKFTTNIPEKNEFVVKAISAFEEKFIPVSDGKFTLKYSIKASTDMSDCPDFDGSAFEMSDNRAYSLFLQSANKTHPAVWYEDNVGKPQQGHPVVRTLANIPNAQNIIWKEARKNKIVFEEPIGVQSLVKLFAMEHKLFIDDTEVLQVNLRTGGVYTVIIGTRSSKMIANIVEIAEPNSVNILWQIPQYVVLTLGEVMFSVTGLEFSYQQAPLSMKSVLQACWLLTVAFGNVIIIIIAEMDIYESQASEFFLFAVLMFVDMLCFSFLAYRYTPNNRGIGSNESVDSNSRESKASVLEVQFSDTPEIKDSPKY